LGPRINRRAEMTRISITNIIPYLLTTLGLLHVLQPTRPLKSLIGTPLGDEIINALTILLDAVEQRESKDKISSKLARTRHKIRIRVWRVLRAVRRQPHMKYPQALIGI
jgi:hypothetical protein